MTKTKALEINQRDLHLHKSSPFFVQPGSSCHNELNEDKGNNEGNRREE